MSSQPQFRTGSMVLMTATLICGVLCVLILLPALERQARLGVLYGPPEQSKEARSAAKILSTKFTEFRSDTQNPAATATATQGTVANQQTSQAVTTVQRSGVISRTVHTGIHTGTDPDGRGTDPGRAVTSHGNAVRPEPVVYAQPGQGQPVFRTAETPQVYVPVTVHPVTVNVDSSGLTTEVARLTQKMEQLVALQESLQQQQAAQEQIAAESPVVTEVVPPASEPAAEAHPAEPTVVGHAVDPTVAAQSVEIQSLRQQLEEVRAAMELLRRESVVPVPEPAPRVADASDDLFERTDQSPVIAFPEPPAFEEPVPADPAVAEPVPADPAVAEPVPADPVISEPAVSEPKTETFEEPAAEPMFLMEPVAESELEPSKAAAPTAIQETFPELEFSAEEPAAPTPELPVAPTPELTTPAVEAPAVEVAPASAAARFPRGAFEIPVEEVSSSTQASDVTEPNPSRLSGSNVSVEQTYQFRSEVLPSPYPLSPVPEVPQGQGSEAMPGMGGNATPDYILPPLEFSPQPFSTHQLPARNPVPHHQHGSDRTGKRFIPGTDIEIRFPKIPRPDFESIPRPKLPRLNFSSSAKPRSAGQRFVNKPEGPGLAAKVGESPAVHRGVSALRFANRPQAVK